MYLSTDQVDIREQSGCMMIVDLFVKLKSCNKFCLEDVSLFPNVCNYLFILFIYFIYLFICLIYLFYSFILGFPQGGGL